MRETVRRMDAILALQDLESFCKTRALPQNLLEHFRAAMESYDRFIDHVVSAEEWEITCGKGCSACCRHELARGVTALEAISIYHFVRPWKDIDQIYENSGQNFICFQKVLLEIIRQDNRPLAPNDARIVEAHLQYNRLRRPCAFLDLHEGKCRIYPVRPIVCRHFFSLSTADWCDPDHAFYLERDVRCMDPYREVKKKMNTINQRLGVRAPDYLSGMFVAIAGDVMEGDTLRFV
jgi:Fe-S-cluster containining protein